jgi:formylglycine-generating enzyme required for sulfatase activity
MGLMAATLPPRLQLLRWRSRTEVFHERLDGLELAMVRIPAGSFVMGSPPEEPERQESEGPQHRVELGEFLLGRTPITQAQWRTVADWAPPAAERWQRQLKPELSLFRPGAEASEFEDRSGARFALLEGELNTDQRPVERVSWHDAMEFCRRLNSRLGPKAGRRYSLPSEAQWEYACRAGTQTPFCFGESITTELANYHGGFVYAGAHKGENRRQTTPVGRVGSKEVSTFPANAWGLYDMHGNMLQWCLDQWHGSYEGASADGSAWIDVEDRNQKVNEESERDAETRLLRGGSWYDSPGSCRSAYRDRIRPGHACDFVGFRVVCLPQDPSLNP